MAPEQAAAEELAHRILEDMRKAQQQEEERAAEREAAYERIGAPA